MPRRRNKQKQPGSSPGSLVYIGEKKVEKVCISVVEYDEQGVKERESEKTIDLLPIKTAPTVTWINVTGIHQVERMRALGELFELHPLLLEDVLNTEQRPKLESYDKEIFLVIKMITADPPTFEIRSEQVSVVLGQRYVISFQEDVGDVFDPVRKRIRKEGSRVRRMGPDYLMYALMDAIVDHYFVVLDGLAVKVEALENDVLNNPAVETLQAIQQLKRDLIFLRRSVWPLREVVNVLVREEHPLISDRTEVFLRDVYDHTIQVIDTLESYRDAASGLLDIYLSSVSNRTNEVMKVLTIVASIFIPLTFIAGIYGMNFENMPELRIPWAYPLVWIVMILVALGMFLYVRKKGWL